MLSSVIAEYLQEFLESGDDCKLVLVVDGKEVEAESIEYDEESDAIIISD